MCGCMVGSDVGKSDVLLVKGILHVCGHVHMQSHMSQGMNWINKSFIPPAFLNLWASPL